MKSERRGKEIGEILWYALQCAKSDRESFVGAYHGDRSVAVVREALRDIQKFKKLQVELFGETDTEIELAMSTMKVVNIMELIHPKGKRKASMEVER